MRMCFSSYILEISRDVSTTGCVTMLTAHKSLVNLLVATVLQPPAMIEEARVDALRTLAAMASDGTSLVVRLCKVLESYCALGLHVTAGA